MQSENIIKYLSDTNTRYGTYHNHKENMAWGVVVLYYAFALKLIDLSFTHPVGTSLQKWVTATFLVVVTLIAWFVLYKQLSLRRDAADVYAGCQRLASICLTLDPPALLKMNWDVLEPSRIGAPFQNYLPARLLQEAEAMSRLGQQSRRRLEFLSYCLLLAAAAIAFGAILFAEPTSLAASANIAASSQSASPATSTASNCVPPVGTTLMASPNITVQVGIPERFSAQGPKSSHTAASAASQTCK